MASGISAIGLGNIRQCVVAADVARRAGRSRVGVCQCEPGGTVIKNTRGPSRDGVARSALRGSGWESRRHVVGNISADRRRALERRRVAAHAIR